ncbi:MAG: hypothetical protein ABIP16_00820 [Thermomonas sp.]
MKHTLMARPAIGSGLILTIPLVMTYLDRNQPEGDGWHWSPLDFLVMAALLFSAGLAYEFLVRRIPDKQHRTMLGLGILCVVLLVWVELAVSGVSQLLDFLFG